MAAIVRCTPFRTSIVSTFLAFVVLSSCRESVSAAGFDCARASLPVDYVICRSDEGRKAIASLTNAWTNLIASVSADRRAALLGQQRQWIKSYPPACGLVGRGRPAPDPTQRTDACVIDHLVRRTSTLQRVASAYNQDHDAPSAFLQEVFAPYQDGDATSITDANVASYFAPALAKQFHDDQATSRQRNAPPRMEADPFTASQDPNKISDVEANAVKLDPTHARGVVSYRPANGDVPRAMTFDLLLGEQGWRIEDILYADRSGSPTGALAQVLAGQPMSTVAPACAFQPTLSMDPASSVQAGTWLPIGWSRCAGTTRLEAPTFLVITVPDEVRLRGVGYFALRPNARAPYGIDFHADRTRIVIPLHQPLMPTLGRVELSPLVVGDLPIDAAVFRRENNRNVELWRSKPMIKTVVPGPPSVSVWESAASEAPSQVRHSADGRWELRIFKVSYEVVDIATGDLVIRRAGINPVFSPTQRFLVARAESDGLEEIVDLEARKVVRQHLEPLIFWTHEDSFALVNGGGWCSVKSVATLVDTIDLGDVNVGVGSHACDAWPDGQVELNADAGYLISIPGGGETNGAYAGVSLTGLPIATGGADGESSIDLPWVRANLDRSYAKPPQGWQTHDAMKVVSFGDPRFTHDYEQMLTSTTKRYWSDASRQVATNDSARINGATPFREPVTRGLVRTDAAGDNVMEASLRRALGRSTDAISVADRAFAGGKDVEAVTTKVSLGWSDKNSTGLQTVPLRIDSGSCQDSASQDPRFFKVEKLLFAISEIGHPSQIAFWPKASQDIVVASFADGGSAFGDDRTQILRRQQDGRWLTDCRHQKTAQAWSSDRGLGHESELPPVAFRFASGDVALLYPVFYQLLLSPADQGAPVCDIRGVREPETLQTLVRIGARLVLLLNKTGDLDFYDCPSGRHVLSGALLDDELVVYSDAGWFDGSAEAASFVQVRLPGVSGRYPLEQFEAALRRPGLLQDAFDGTPLPPAFLSEPPFLHLVEDGRSVSAGDSKGLAAIRFYEDGVKVQDVPASGRITTIPIPVDKLGQARQAAAVVVNEAGIESAPLPLPATGAGVARRGRLSGLSVGVDAYTDPHFPRLGFAEHDATALADTLNKDDRAHTSAAVDKLTGANVTADGVLQAILAKVKSTKPDDTLVFAFAGHGVAQNHDLLLAMPGSDYDHLDQTALRWSDVEAALAQSAARVVVFLDACQSGSAALGSGDQHEAAVDRLKTWSGPPVLIFAASKAGQSAQESATAGGGLFTAAIVRALDDRSANAEGHLLTLEELYGMVKRKVMAESGGAQIPWFGRRGLLGDFVLF